MLVYIIASLISANWYSKRGWFSMAFGNIFLGQVVMWQSGIRQCFYLTREKQESVRCWISGWYISHWGTNHQLLWSWPPRVWVPPKSAKVLRDIDHPLWVPWAMFFMVEAVLKHCKIYGSFTFQDFSARNYRYAQQKCGKKRCKK